MVRCDQVKDTHIRMIDHKEHIKLIEDLIKKPMSRHKEIDIANPATQYYGLVCFPKFKWQSRLADTKSNETLNYDPHHYHEY